MAATAKLRLDRLLVERGLAASRERAQALILAGQVRVAGQPAGKSGLLVAADAEVSCQHEDLPYASRAGGKLAAALDHFQIAVQGRVALDIGSSTGGFTDCLLQRGARQVIAVDSGDNQMIWRLRSDLRVKLFERTNARYLTAAAVGLEGLEGEARPDLLTMDVSFISATLLLPPAVAILDRPADIVVLVKPQFEAGREAVGRGGIVRDPAAHAAACARVTACLEELGARGQPPLASPVLGATGNQEFLLAARLSVKS